MFVQSSNWIRVFHKMLRLDGNLITKTFLRFDWNIVKLSSWTNSITRPCVNWQYFMFTRWNRCGDGFDSNFRQLVTKTDDRSGHFSANAHQLWTELFEAKEGWLSSLTHCWSWNDKTWHVYLLLCIDKGPLRNEMWTYTCECDADWTSWFERTRPCMAVMAFLASDWLTECLAVFRLVAFDRDKRSGGSFGGARQQLVVQLLSW